MWPLYLVTSNNQRVLLHVQDTDVHNADVIHLDARMARSRWHGHTTTLGDVARLFGAHYDVHTGAQRPLFFLDSPYALQLESEGPSFLVAGATSRQHQVHRLATTTVEPVTQDGKWLVMMTTAQGGRFSARLWVTPTQQCGHFAVWRVHCTVHTARYSRGTQHAAVLSAARSHHLYSGRVLRRVAESPNDTQSGPVGAFQRAWLQGDTGAQEAVSACVAWDEPATITAQLPSDGVMLSALNVGYSVEAGHSLLTTEIGDSLLASNTAPGDAIRQSPSAWITKAVERVHGGQAAPSAWSDAYRGDAQLFGEQIGATIVEKMRGWFDEMQGKVPEWLKRVLPSEETIKTLQAIDVKKAATDALSTARDVATSNTATAVISTIGMNPKVGELLPIWSKAVLADLRLDDTAVGDFVIKNSSAVETAMVSMLKKMRYLNPSDLKQYGATFRSLIGNKDMYDGVLQLAALASKSGKFLADNASTAVAVAKTTGKLLADNSGTLVSAAGMAAKAAGTGAKLLTGDSIDASR